MIRKKVARFICVMELAEITEIMANSLSQLR